MKRRLIVVVCSTTLLVAVFVVAQLSAPGVAAESARGNREVVLMRCKAANAAFDVVNFQGSTNSPTRRAGGCAENLSMLVREGFTINDVGYSRDLETMVYTMSR